MLIDKKEAQYADGTLERPMANSAYEFEQMQKRAEKERGIVMPGLNEAEVRVVYVPRHDFDGSGKDALRAAEKWAKGNIAGIHQARDNRGEKFNYSISNDTIEKYVSRSATGKSENIGVHLAVLKKLPEIIGDSIEAEVHADYKKQDGLRTSGSEVNSLSLVHRFYAAVNMDGVPYRVKITMREHADSNMSTVAHSYEVTQIELLKAPSDNTISTVEPLAMTSNSSISVAKLLHGVEKSYDSGKKLLDESVKVSEMERPGANVGGGIEAEAVESMGVRMGVRVVVDRTLGSRGAYNPNTGEVRVNPDAHKSMADLERTMAHEIVGHKGIHSLLGKSFDKVCERVSHLIDSEADKALGSLFRNWGTMSRRERGAEYMAWLAEKGGENTNPGKWQRVCGYIRVAMRRMGFGFEVTDADVRYMLYVSAKRATKAGGGQPIRRPEL